MTADGSPVKIRGINKIGLERHEVPKGRIRGLREAYRILFRRDLGVEDAILAMGNELDDGPELQRLIAFVRSSERGLSR